MKAEGGAGLEGIGGGEEGVEVREGGSEGGKEQRGRRKDRNKEGAV